MAKTLSFKWIPSININEKYKGICPDSFLEVVNVWTIKNINQLIEAAKNVENFSKVEVKIGEKDSVILSSITAPIKLISHLNIHGYHNEYRVSDEAPSLEWLLKHKEELTNFNKVFYVDNMAVYFSLDPNKMFSEIAIAIFNIAHIDTYVTALENYYIEGLDKPLEDFLESYGYTDVNMYESIAKAILTFQAVKKLGFVNAEEVVAYFNGKRLVADLKLKGLLEDIASVLPLTPT